MCRTLYPVAIFIMLLFSSCKGQVSVTDSAGNHSKMELILQDNYSGFEEEKTLIIKDKQSLEKFFGKINRTRKPGLPVPEIGFTKEMVLVWCVGSMNTTTPKLLILKETHDSLVFQRKIAKDFQNTTATISPFIVYKLPISDKVVVVE